MLIPIYVAVGVLVLNNVLLGLALYHVYKSMLKKLFDLTLLANSKDAAEYTLNEIARNSGVLNKAQQPKSPVQNVYDQQGPTLDGISYPQEMR